MSELMEFAARVPEFRRTTKGNFRHKLSDMVVLELLARMSKCVSRCDIIEFGRQNLRRFQSMGILLCGIPSEPTLCRAWQCISNPGLEREMARFVSRFHKQTFREVVNIDGKAERGTVLENGRNPDIVSAYVPGKGLTLATEACQTKSNEITAVPVLLDKLNVSGCIVTADAMSCQKAIVDKLRLCGADFVVEVKANQRALCYSLEDNLKKATPVDTWSEGPELAHGRIETREYRAFDGRALIADKEKWAGRLTVVETRYQSIEKKTGKSTGESRIYLSSLMPKARELASVIRSHWAIESMHWQLDYNLKQDNIKRKHGKSARNLDTIQRMVLAVFSIWKSLRRKKSDKAKGLAQLMRELSVSFTRLTHFLSQK